MKTELLFRDDAYLTTATAAVTAADERGIRLDRTVFYANSGGQPGDIGHLLLEDGGRIEIVDTVKGETLEDILHKPAPDSALPPLGAKLAGTIDWPRRHRLMRMHTCLHLISAIVKGEISGAQVGDGKGRVDFNMPDRSIDKSELEDALNRVIAAGHACRPFWISDEEMLARPELVRTMTVRPPMGYGRVRLLEIVGVDLQPCGGTHVKNTAEIGPVEIVKIESKGKANRRVNVALRE